MVVLERSKNARIREEVVDFRKGDSGVNDYRQPIGFRNDGGFDVEIMVMSMVVLGEMFGIGIGQDQGGLCRLDRRFVTILLVQNRPNPGQLQIQV